MDKIEKVKAAKLVLFCWGEDNNDSNAINTLKQRGVDGIIYDRWVTDVNSQVVNDQAQPSIGTLKEQIQGVGRKLSFYKH